MNDGLDLNELFEAHGKRLCPYHPHGCEWVGTYRCTAECEYHPENYHVKKEVIERFEKEPWAVYCLTCEEFLDTRYGHPESHLIATGLAEYREKLPQHIIDILKDREAETGDMNF
jgi:hypothetical protein